MSERARCAGITKAGKPCKGRPLDGSTYCMAHQDQVVLDIAAERKRLHKGADRDDETRQRYVDFLESVVFGHVKEEKAVGGKGVKHVKPALATRLAYGQELADMMGWKERGRDDEGSDDPGTVDFVPLQA